MSYTELAQAVTGLAASNAELKQRAAEALDLSLIHI